MSPPTTTIPNEEDTSVNENQIVAQPSIQEEPTSPPPTETTLSEDFPDPYLGYPYLRVTTLPFIPTEREKGLLRDLKEPDPIKERAAIARARQRYNQPTPEQLEREKKIKDLLRPIIRCFEDMKKAQLEKKAALPDPVPAKSIPSTSSVAPAKRAVVATTARWRTAPLVFMSRPPLPFPRAGPSTKPAPVPRHPADAAFRAAVENVLDQLRHPIESLNQKEKEKELKQAAPASEGSKAGKRKAVEDDEGVVADEDRDDDGADGPRPSKKAKVVPDAE
ncbi:hypothetical protein ONZ45_g10297 [Pleurotus djamor]|nr:hypothetical protein ONZ45_g10297 [Pleurotus djamor]